MGATAPLIKIVSCSSSSIDISIDTLQRFYIDNFGSHQNISIFTLKNFERNKFALEL